MDVPAELIKSLRNINGFDEEAFINIHASGEQVTSIRINPNKIDTKSSSIFNFLPLEEGWGGTVLWCEYGCYLKKRPSFTFDPFFHAGCYYVQEASSMFLEQVLKQTIDLSQPIKVLDLCAAPGGKSTHIQSLITPNSLLVSNETIKIRSNILTSNILKWGTTNVVVTNNDPAAFKKLSGYFDVIVVDAPCSGSGLFRKDTEAIKEWSLNNVALCCQRQQRILADVLPALKTGGLLIYSTCSYSKEEDEDIADWLIQEFKMESLKLTVEESWGIVETETLNTKATGYRFFPDKVEGEGFYIACFRKTLSSETIKLKTRKQEKLPLNEQAIIKKWLSNSDVEFLQLFGRIYALPKLLINDLSFLRNILNVQYAGVEVGEVINDKMIPTHALAMSTLINDSILKVNVSYADAIKYLQKQDVKIQSSVKGWQIVAYENKTLGWINSLQNRINNYYPKELRILKQHPG